MKEENRNDSLKNDSLKEKLQELERKAQEYLDGWKRAKADYLNYKKETERRQKEMLEFALIAKMMHLIPILDHFTQAFHHIPPEIKNSQWVQGIHHIHKQLENFFHEMGFKKIETVGKDFNPALHEAVAHEEKSGFKSNQIFEEVKAGYTFHGKTIIPAKVKVAK